MNLFLTLSYFICINLISTPLASSSHFNFTDYNFNENLPGKTIPIEEKLSTIKGKLLKSSNVMSMNLKKTNLNSSTFKRLTKCLLTEPLIESSLKSFQILEISDNKIDENAAPSIAKWLLLTSKPYIKLTGNPIALKNISKLYTGFTNNGFSNENINKFMKKIIFVSKEYVRKASKTVQIYKTLVDNKIIPRNWACIHSEFYNLKFYKSLLKQEEINQFNLVMEKMERLSILSPSQLQSSNEEKEEDSISFNKAFKIFTPKYSEDEI